MFKRVLVANRGEIAARIVRACSALDVETVVVHSEADRDAPWLEDADQSICIGPARADASYLNQDAILQAAEQSDAQAVHPGYGFLAENARFAARCRQQGLAFVGPTAEAIRRMGDKIEAKRTLARAGLPTIPGSEGVVNDAGQARDLASKFGYPVLLKAASGGGGKGMRLCTDDRELESGFEQARIEAEKAFGNGDLYLEKFISGGRHVEFQVLCDAYGSAVHLGERECSIQRQHQKLLEESPSPVIDTGSRNSLGARVAAAVARVGYRNAGTVEFLRDSDGQMYFMEMNTRLQVEHPVTEMITGVDLVEQQLRIAANEPLSLSQSSIRFQGHALEMRINAEDPDRDFRPDPGLITEFTPPRIDAQGVQLRWDSAIRSGYRIPPHYDSMVGKLIVHAGDRRAAIDAAAAALDSMRIEGIRTTLDLHRRLVRHETFRSGDYDVGFLAASGLLTAAKG